VSVDYLKYHLNLLFQLQERGDADEALMTVMRTLSNWLECLVAESDILARALHASKEASA